MSATAMDFYWQMPPMSRTIATATFILSIGIWTSLLPMQWFMFHTYYIWKFPPQLWRLVTSFLITGPKLSILFDTYFLFTNLSQLEIGNPRFPRREDLLWYLIFVGGVTITLNVAFLGFAWRFLSALIVALAYTVTQDQRGMKATFVFFTIPAQLLPYCMILVNLLFPDGLTEMMIQITGLVAAHLYDFLTRIYPEFGGGRNLIPTPAFLSRFVTTPRVLERAYGTAFRNNAAADAGPGRTTGASTGASTGGGPLPDSWRSRGSGRRLGGD